jgi:formylglycine-generating enzyme required for sulfatase activity
MSANLSLAGTLLLTLAASLAPYRSTAAQEPGADDMQATRPSPGKGKQAEVSFPFPVEVDKTKGKTGIYPNRIQDRDSGTWYVFVPGGKYQLGSDRQRDSKPIQVTLTEFYISERQVSYGQIARHIERQLQEAMKGVESNIAKDATPAQAQDARLVAEVKAITIIQRWWPKDLKLDIDSGDFLESAPGVLERNRKWEALRGQKMSAAKLQGMLECLTELKKELAAWNRDMKATRGLVAREAAVKSTLTPEQREQARKIRAAFKERIAATSRGDEPYPTAHYLDARLYATSHGVSLPTEAQWEAAAQLLEAKRLQLEGMFDPILEWCSDYYAHDYYHRRDDLKDPQGPRRPRISPEQLHEEFYDSGLGLGRRLIARDMRVLRGGDRSTRAYGRAGEKDLLGLPYEDSFRRAKGIRLVYNPRR